MVMKMNPGKLNKRIVIEQSTTIKDELGQVIEKSWVEFKKPWASVKTIKGSEYIAASTSQGTLIYRFIIRYTTGITKDMRINFNGRIFDIIEPPINDDELNITLTIIAKERV